MSYIAERRLEEKERRRAEILDAAEAVSASVGLEATTMDEVARQARLSRALVYVYFNDKADLLAALCERGLIELRDRFAAAAAAEPSGVLQVEAIGRAYVSFSRERPVHFEALARFETRTAEAVDPSTNEGACVAAGDRVHEVMVECIEAGIRDGSISPTLGNPQLASLTLWGFMHGIIQLASAKANTLARDGVSPDQLVEQALRMATRSLSARL